MRILHLYRPRVPSLRAQAIQVVHTCHALARRGHEVTLFADRADCADATEALARYGLDHPASLHLKIAPTANPPLSGLWFRAQVHAWGRDGGVVYARAKRYIGRIPRKIPVILEAHEVDSVLAAERGEDPAPAQRLERSVLARVSGVVGNCAGTLQLLAATHRHALPTCVIWNATCADRVVARAPSERPLAGLVGPPAAWKGMETVLSAPAVCDIEVVGSHVIPPYPAHIRWVPPVAYGELPAWLARYHVLLLPLVDNVYGRHLANPLKLWDYLATGIPIVAADLPTLREVAGDTLHYYPPGDPLGFAAALTSALTAQSRPPRLRTWDDRAAEIEAFLAVVT